MVSTFLYTPVLITPQYSSLCLITESEVLSMESDEESQPATPTTPKDPIGDYLNDISQKVSNKMYHLSVSYRLFYQNVL